MAIKIKQWATGLLGGGLILGTSAGALAQGPDDAGDWHPGMMNGGWEGWFLGPFTMLAFIIVVVALIIFLVRWLGGGPVHGPRSSGMPGAPERPDRAMDVLRERYAKGEINREEFEERRRTLLSD